MVAGKLYDLDKLRKLLERYFLVQKMGIMILPSHVSSNRHIFSYLGGAHCFIPRAGHGGTLQILHEDVLKECLNELMSYQIDRCD